MNNYSILVADSGENVRTQVVQLLTKRGYRLYQATDGAGALRIARSILPDLVILDVNLWGMKSYEVARIIEGDQLSTVVFMTSSLNPQFLDKLKHMRVYAYITKPVQPEQLYHMVEFSIVNSNKINNLVKQVEKLENSLAARKKIDKAKGLLMERRAMTEGEAYQWLRRQSMDRCITLEKIAEEIINQELP
ncbi:ANTAR domain-containing response regulator [Alkaliphilus crotonatoxidans]